MAALIERHHRLIVILTLSLAALLSLPLPGLRIDSSFEGWIDSEGALYRTYADFTKTFGPDDSLLLVFRTRDLITAEQASKPPGGRYLEFVDALSVMEGVTRVLDPVGGYLDQGGTADGLALALESKSTIAPRIHELLPERQGMLVADDLETLGLLVSLDPTQRQKHLETIQRIRQAFDKLDIPYQLAGIPYFSTVLAATMSQDLVMVVALLMLMALGILFFFLRSSRVVLSVLAGIIVGLTVTLGLGMMLGIHLTLLALILFPLLFCVGLTTAIHLFARRKGGRWTPEFAYACVLKPATIAMITTALGTGAFLFAPQPAIREMGVLLPLGIVLVYLSVMLFTPALFRWINGGWHLPELPKRCSLGKDRFGITGRKRVSLFLILAAIGSAFLLSAIKINPDAIFFFQQKSDLVRSYRQIEERLTGLMAVELVIRTRSGDSILDSTHREQITSFLKSLDPMPSLTSRVSAFDLLPAEGEPPSPILSSFLSDNHQAMRVSLRYRNLSSQSFMDVASTLRRNWDAGGGHRPGLKMAITGQLPLILMTQERLLHSQAVVFLFIFSLVSLLLLVILRSWRILALALLANFVPLLITAGAMVIMNIPINSINLFVASVLLGVIVDDTIHLLHAYHDSGNMASALAQVKAALWITTVTVCLSFAALLTSRIVPVIQFGLLSVIAVISAYLCDTCLLPLLASTRRSRLDPA